jgi:hypothetical protein
VEQGFSVQYFRVDELLTALQVGCGAAAGGVEAAQVHVDGASAHRRTGL